MGLRLKRALAELVLGIQSSIPSSRFYERFRERGQAEKRRVAISVTPSCRHGCRKSRSVCERRTLHRAIQVDACSISWTPFATQSSFPCAHVSRCLTLVITTVRANMSIDELARTYIAKIERQQRAQSTGRFPLIRDRSECARHFSCGNAVPINVRRENSL